MDFSPNIVYQDSDLILCRKPQDLASSWGQEFCFLDSIKSICTDSNNSILSRQKYSHYELRQHQWLIFGEEGEYGLLNRLDNDTTGLLYFAKSIKSKKNYQDLQTQQKITKVYGIPRGEFWEISFTVYHHRDDTARMTTDPNKARGQGQEVVTQRNKLEYDITKNTSWLQITITSGCRHQIRCHLASIGHAILGDTLYMSKKQRQKLQTTYYQLQLLSAGLEIK